MISSLKKQNLETFLREFPLKSFEKSLKKSLQASQKNGSISLKNIPEKFLRISEKISDRIHGRWTNSQVFS